MGEVKSVLDWATAALFALSLLALRFAVKSMIEGGKSTFSLFHNLSDRSRTRRCEALHLGLRAIWTMFPWAAGARINAAGMGDLTSRAHLYALAEDAKKYRDADPKFYDEVVYAVRAVAWGKITMWAAMGAFLCKVADSVIGIWVK
jgi:hypothetical protein